jgi:hypothetical protein
MPTVAAAWYTLAISIRGNSTAKGSHRVEEVHETPGGGHGAALWVDKTENLER